MNTFSLYPYNLYILYASMIAVLICIGILLLRHLLPLLQALGRLTPPLEKISKNAEALAEKTEVLANEPDYLGYIASAQKYLGLFSLTRTIYKAYRKAEQKGLKQMQKSAMEVIQKRQMMNSLKQEISKYR